MFDPLMLLLDFFDENCIKICLTENAKVIFFMKYVLKLKEPKVEGLLLKLKSLCEMNFNKAMN